MKSVCSVDVVWSIKIMICDMVQLYLGDFVLPKSI